MADRRVHRPGRPRPLTAFPLSIVVFCDRCGVEVEHDYVVHDLMTREQRLDVAREHMARNEGWSCTAEGDYCPVCEPRRRRPAGPGARREQGRMSDVWIINGRCEDCVRDEHAHGEHDPDACGCWCHDTCPDCGRGDCTGEDCYWPDEAGLRADDRR